MTVTGGQRVRCRQKQEEQRCRKTDKCTCRCAKKKISEIGTLGARETWWATLFNLIVLVRMVLYRGQRQGDRSKDSLVYVEEMKEGCAVMEVAWMFPKSTSLRCPQLPASVALGSYIHGKRMSGSAQMDFERRRDELEFRNPTAVLLFEESRYVFLSFLFQLPPVLPLSLLYRSLRSGSPIHIFVDNSFREIFP